MLSIVCVESICGCIVYIVLTPVTYPSPQDEFYATHQIFLTPKAVYLAVWNVLHGRAGVERLKLWLLNINVSKQQWVGILLTCYYGNLTVVLATRSAMYHKVTVLLPW